MKRDEVLDSLKYLSMMEVIFIHFMYFFNENLLTYIRKTLPYSLLFNGLSAKVGLAILAVLSGYFSYRSNKNKNFILFLVKKYLYYVLYCFAANLIYCLINHDQQFAFSLPDILIKSLLFEDDYYYYLWFVKSFFIGNILSFLLGKLNVPTYIITALFLCSVLVGEQYISVFFLGCILASVSIMNKEKKFIQNDFVHLIFVFLIFLLPKIETEYAYVLYGFIGVLLFVLSQTSDVFKKLLQNKFMSYYGRMTMSILIVHYGCMFIFEKIENMPLLSTFLLWLVVTHFTAYIVSIPLASINRKMNEMTDVLFRNIISMVRTND